MAHIAVPDVELGLDHVSIEVPDFADAVGRLDEQLGLQVTVSPQAPERHGRVYLDRAYLEVAANLGRRSWAVTSFFVRFSDPVGLRARLGGARLGYRCQVYEGVDGRWEDVELDVAGVPVPILVRRTEPLTSMTRRRSLSCHLKRPAQVKGALSGRYVCHRTAVPCQAIRGGACPLACSASDRVAGRAGWSAT